MKILYSALFLALFFCVPACFGQDFISQCKSNNLSQAEAVQKLLEMNWDKVAPKNPYIISELKQKASLQSELDFIRATQKGLLAGTTSKQYRNSSAGYDYDNMNIKHHEESIAKIDADIKFQKDIYFKLNSTNAEIFVKSKY